MLNKKYFLLTYLVLISTIKLAISEDLVFLTAPFSPFRIVTGGSVIGSDADIVKEVFARIGYKVKFEVMPFKRAWNLTKSGKYVGFVSLTKNPEREQFVYFSDPLSTVKDVFFKRKSDSISWKKMSDLKEYKVGESGYNYAKVFKNALKYKLFKKIETINSDNPEMINFKKLTSKRIDIFICEVSVGKYIINSTSPLFDSIDFINKPIGEVRPFYATFSIKYPNSETLVKSFNEELKKYVKEGKRKLVFEKYGIETDLE